jgi:signal transduction histidine kinase
MPSSLPSWRSLLVGAAFCSLCSWGTATGVAAHAVGPPTALTGPLHIAQCDEAACELPGEEDPRWVPLRLAASGLDRPLPHREGTAWVRLAFTLPASPGYADPALLLSRPADAEEVFLNGVRMGGEGRVGISYVTASDAPRVVLLAPRELRAGENELALRVLFSGKNARAFDGPLWLGERDRIVAEAEVLSRPLLLKESAFLSVFALLLAFYAFLISRGAVGGDDVLFIAFTGVYALEFLLGSHLLSLAGLAAPWMDRVRVVLAASRAPLMLFLVTSATGSRRGWVFGSLCAVGVTFVVLYALLPMLTGLVVLAAPRKAFLTVLGLYCVILAAKAVLDRRRESLPILAAVTAWVVGSRGELLWGLNTRDYAVAAFALCMLSALGARHARLGRRVLEVSSRLLAAHEEERRRIARDIHDGVGQSLLALRLRLQMMASKTRAGSAPSAEAMDALAHDAVATVEEVRRTTLDLRPSFIDSMSFVEAMRWYAESFEVRHHLEVQIHEGKDLPPDLPGRLKDNLYRVYQEILANAAKHSKATQVVVSVFRQGGKLFLQVADNGVGFMVSEERRDGMGLATMRERAELLGGICSVDSRPGGGTRVTVEVPIQ